MTSKRERRAAALEAIANALLELAAVERESEEIRSEEILVDRRTCIKELGLGQRAFLDAAGREFPAFLVSKRITAMKADVLAWLRSRKVERKATVPKPARDVTLDPDTYFCRVQALFEARVGRPMTDDELYQADIHIGAGHSIAAHYREVYKDTPDDVAASVQSKIGKEPRRHGEWRSLGLDVAQMERQGEELREKLRTERPEMPWSERVDAVLKMWSEVTEPLSEARRAARKAAREARKAKTDKHGLPARKR